MLVPIDGVITLVAIRVALVLQSGGCAGAARSRCIIAVQQQHYSVQLPFLLARWLASMVNCWDGDMFFLSGRLLAISSI